MLTKRQLEDAARCTIIDCEDCSVYCINTIETTRRCGRTALAYRVMLERLEWSLKGKLRKTSPEREYYCPICENNKRIGHASDCELAALLKESEVEHDE